MKLPAWASVHHPIAHRERALWDRALRRWRWLWIPLILLPIGCSALCGLVTLPTALEDNSLLGWLFTIGSTLLVGTWAMQGFLNFGLNLFLSVGASTLVARERETQNWAMLRLTILSIPEIVASKLAALLHQARWPIVAVLLVRGLATAITAIYGGILIYATVAMSELSADWTPLISPAAIWATFAVGAVVFAAYTVVETAAGVAYNCGVGLLASCFSRSSGAAVGVTFVLHFILWFFVLLPIQQFIFPLVFAFGLTLPSGVAEYFIPVASSIVSFMMPLFFETVVAAGALMIAFHQAQSIVE